MTRPDAMPPALDDAPADPVVAAVLAHLEAHLDEPVTLDELAGVVGLSPSHLQRRVAEATGLSPKKLQQALRLRRFRHAVRDDGDVGRATYAAGFGSSRGLYETAGEGLGMTPGRYAKQGAGLRVVTHLVDSSLGRALVGCTDQGVCAVLLGDDDETLRAELAREFPKATVVDGAHGDGAHGDCAHGDCAHGDCAHGDGAHGDGVIGGAHGADARDELAARQRVWVQRVLDHLTDSREPVAVPLDAHGTPFQVRVWRALRDIPAGERRTYGELARALGSPAAVRAVGRACGSNAIAVLVPCHRVVRADGGLGGYRWGLERKRRLLDAEAR